MSSIIIVIDDDPTGCQTVHDVPILTSWNIDLLSENIDKAKTFFILSNTRALSPQDAYHTTLEIALNIKSIIKPDAEFRIISRSDSTLRGHLKEEISALLEVFGPYDGTVFVPYFKEGGRITIEDEHYVETEGSLIRASETEFAKDPVLGFRSSHLPTYVYEKGKGLWIKDHFISISLQDIREGGAEKIAEKLSGAKDNIAIIVNAENDTDLDIAIKGIIIAENNGKKFLYRTAASFVRIRAGISKKPVIEPEKKVESCLIVAGSFVNKTSLQLTDLENNCDIDKIQIDTQVVVSSRDIYLDKIVRQIDELIRNNRTVLLCTEREYKGNGTDTDKIELGRKLSDFLCRVVSRISSQPELIIAKGGITSHVVLKDGLGVNAAIVQGQVEPGIPMLRLQEGSKFPGSLFVIFPGNVGNHSTLTKIVKKYTYGSNEKTG